MPDHDLHACFIAQPLANKVLNTAMSCCKFYTSTLHIQYQIVACHCWAKPAAHKELQTSAATTSFASHADSQIQ